MLNKFILQIKALVNNNEKIVIKKQWIKLNELTPFMLTILWLTRLRKTPLEKEFYILLERIRKLIGNNGWTFTFNYLKGVNHTVVRYFANTPLESTYFGKALVKVCPKSGLPIFFRKELRDEIIKWDRAFDLRKIIALISFLNVYRSFQTKVEPDLSSITDSFTGTADTLSYDIVKAAVHDAFGKRKFPKKLSAYAVNSTRAGPNSHQSIWGAEIDVFALVQSSIFLPWIQLMINTGSYFILSWYLVLLLLGSPYYLVSRLFSSGPSNGRLAIVYDQAGKARVVAMTNWWIQCVFKPLHDYLFVRIRELSTDATFDQKGRLDTFVKKTAGSTWYCYDLSAATDRLPIRLQEDILNIMGYSGSLWKSIISQVKWRYKKRYITYEVGQPMGAYSSWAMLAVTHHIIVRAAALSLKIFNYDRYLVLGDDIVIADQNVAEAYLRIMDLLGVSINLSKSIISSEILEFAKCWRNSSYDISPIGSGLIVQAIRERGSFITLVTEVWERQILSWPSMLATIASAPKALGLKIHFAVVHQHLVILNSLFKQVLDEDISINTFFKEGVEETNLLFDRIKWFRSPYNFHDSELYPDRDHVAMDVHDAMHQSIRETLLDEIWMDMRKDAKTIFNGIKQLSHYSWRTSTLRLGLPALFDLFLLPLKPAVWVHMMIICRSFTTLVRKYYYIWRVEIHNFAHSYIYSRNARQALYSQNTKLFLYWIIMEMPITVHFYVEEVQKRKKASRLISRILSKKYSKILKDTLGTLKIRPNGDGFSRPSWPPIGSKDPFLTGRIRLVITRKLGADKTL
jgi:hypothetical protein